MFNSCVSMRKSLIKPNNHKREKIYNVETYKTNGNE